MFPGILGEIPSARWGDWFPVVLVTMFNAGDLAGKLAAQCMPRLSQYLRAHGGRRLLLAALLRLALAPLLMLCAAPRAAPLLPGEAPAIVLTLLLGLSNGFIATLCMQTGPGLAPPAQRETAGGFQTLALLAGLTLGATCAMPLLAIVRA